MSDADKAAIDEVSGEALVRMAGKAWDTADEAGLAALEGTVDFHDATEEEVVAIEEMSQPLYDTVRKAFDEKGVDFDACSHVDSECKDLNTLFFLISPVTYLLLITSTNILHRPKSLDRQSQVQDIRK